MKLRQGFTLMELLVVLLIIGILSTVALRTIDATRDRALFDQTADKMNKLVQAIVGNPDLTFDGRRVDFGYYGDMEKLPDELTDLVRPPTATPAWNGPYLKLTLGGDTATYLYDAWGRPFTYNPTLGTISSIGNNKYPMTVKIVDSLPQLFENVIAGTITDRDNAAPGEQSLTILTVKLYYNNREDSPGGVGYAMVTPDPSGYYEFSRTSPFGPAFVPIGTHKLVAATATESLIRYVTVIPRSKTIVDFKFSSSFWNKLRMVGAPVLTPGNDGFLIRVINDQANEVTLTWLRFFNTPDSAYMRDFSIAGSHVTIPDGQPGVGPGDTVNFNAPVTIAPFGAQEVELAFLWFRVNEVIPPDPDVPTDVRGKTFQFRFSDGSEITVKP